MSAPGPTISLLVPPPCPTTPPPATTLDQPTRATLALVMTETGRCHGDRRRGPLPATSSGRFDNSLAAAVDQISVADGVVVVVGRSEIYKPKRPLSAG